MIRYEVVFPELTSVMAVKRADIIVCPSSWHGEFGSDMDVFSGYVKNAYATGSMSIWNAVAIGSQAYTIVANFVGSPERFFAARCTRLTRFTD